MRKVTLGLANSLDNYIARADGTCDWLLWDDETAAVSSAYLQTVDTFLIGRKTYEVMLANADDDLVYRTVTQIEWVRTGLERLGIQKVQ